jgi:hypothetical protein
MSKYIAFVVLLALRLSYQPGQVKTDMAPFAKPSPMPVMGSVLTAKLINFKADLLENKVILKWAVDENESAEMFEIEKSTDGKTFRMTGLVFGTDHPEGGSYQFYEKAGNQKVKYRIKLINKNKRAEYSNVIEINPNV